MSLNTAFERTSLTEALKVLKKFCASHGLDYKELRQHSWGLKGSNYIEFQINACPSCPEGFYHLGRNSETVTGVKAEGYIAFMGSIDEEWLYNVD